MDANSMAADLDRQFGIPGVARVCDGNGAMPRVQITSPLCDGEIYLHGAHITSWKPTGADEVLFLSSKSRWEEGQAIRGGIPICFPWFRAKVDDLQAPAHGFVRTKACNSRPLQRTKTVLSSACLPATMSARNTGGLGSFV